MKILKNTAITLCAAALILLCASCSTNSSDSPEISSPSTEENTPNQSEDGNVTESGTDGEHTAFNFDLAYEAFEPDTVMLTAGEYDITWEELFFYICNSISYIDQGTGFNLSDIATEDITYSELIMTYAIEDALSYKAIQYGSKLMSVSLNDEEKSEIKETYESAVTEFGGEEALLERLREYSNIYSRELFEYLVGTDMLVSRCFEEMYGTDASKLPDEAVEDFIKTNGYLKAKHILRLNSSDDTLEGNENTALAEAEEILKKLDEYEGNDLESYFDELMMANSEDSGGLLSYPDGYLFMPGTMVPEFYDGCFVLEPGQYSGIIESSHGYHIIYRLPFSFDDVPYEYSSQGSSSTLRQIAASNVFGTMLADWADSLEVTYSDTYNTMSLEDIFR